MDHGWYLDPLTSNSCIAHKNGVEIKLEVRLRSKSQIHWDVTTFNGLPVKDIVVSFAVPNKIDLKDTKCSDTLDTLCQNLSLKHKSQSTCTCGQTDCVACSRWSKFLDVKLSATREDHGDPTCTYWKASKGAHELLLLRVPQVYHFMVIVEAIDDKKCPTLYLSGDSDKKVDKELDRLMAALDRAGHWTAKWLDAVEWQEVLSNKSHHGVRTSTYAKCGHWIEIVGNNVVKIDDRPVHIEIPGTGEQGILLSTSQKLDKIFLLSKDIF